MKGEKWRLGADEVELRDILQKMLEILNWPNGSPLEGF